MNGLLEVMRGALEEVAMERQTEGKVTCSPFVQRIFEHGIPEGKRDALLRGFTLFRIGLTDDEAARIRACQKVVLLDRWVDTIQRATTAREVRS